MCLFSGDVNISQQHFDRSSGLEASGFPFFAIFASQFHPSRLRGLSFLDSGVSYDISNLVNVADVFVATQILIPAKDPVDRS
jgi:hypothetical protein